MEDLIDYLIASSQAPQFPPHSALPQAPRVGAARLQVFTGIHGAGKRALLAARARELLAAGVPAGQVLLFDFSDARLAGVRGPQLPARVLDRFFARNPDARRATCHVLLHRVDLVEDWATGLARLADVYDLRVMATGEQTGWLRAGVAALPRPFEVLELAPLSLRAFTQVNGGPDGSLAAPAACVADYLEQGGIPQTAAYGGRHAHAVRLQGLVRDAVLVKAAADPALRDVPLALRVAALALGATGTRFSVTGAVKALQEEGVRTTRATVSQQLAALEGLHLLYTVPDFDAAAKPNPRAAATLYAGDHALCTAFAPQGEPLGLAVVRNAVYLHLRRMESTDGIYTYKAGSAGSVDFALAGVGAGAPAALFHVGHAEPGPAFKRTLALLDQAMARAGLRSAVLIHPGPRHTAQRTPHGTVRCVPLGSWLLGE